MVPSVLPAAARQPRKAADSAALAPPKDSPKNPGFSNSDMTISRDKPAEERTTPPAAAQFFGEENDAYLRWCQNRGIGGTPREGGWGPGKSAVPTERPRKLRCLQEPSAWAGSSLAAEGADPGRAVHAAPPSALSAGERERGNRATARGARPTRKLVQVPGSSEPEGGRKQPSSARFFPCRFLFLSADRR